MGSNRIKGITIDIGGDTTSLEKSLKNVDNDLKKTRQNLSDVNRLLKFDPKNTELLAQKQKLLSDSIGSTKDRLETLKTAANNASEALKNGTMSQDQYDGLQREIAETESNLKYLEDQAKKTDEAVSKIGQAGAAIQEFGSKTEEAGKSLTKNVTAPIAAVGAGAISAFSEVDAGMDTVTRKTGATGAALDSLHESFKNVYGSLPVTAQQAGDAIGEINTRFGATGAELEALATEFLKFSSITGADVTSSVDSVDAIMKKFNVDSSQTSNVLGLLASASQKSGISIQTLENALSSQGAALKEMGFDLTESVNLLSQLELNGVDVSTAMTGLKKSVQNATKEGKSAEEALTETIDSIKNAKTETEALQIATDLFGAKGAPEMTQAIREGRISVDDLSGSLSEFSGVVDTTFENTQSGPDELRTAMNNLKLAGADLGATLFDVLAPVIKEISEAMKGLKEWFDGLSPSTKELIVKIALLAATLGPVLIIVGKLITAIGAIMTIFPAVKGAILAVNAALAANPILAVILVIEALVAAFLILWNNCDEFRQFWIDLWEGIKEKASEAWSAITGFFSDAWNKIQEVFAGIGSWFADRWSDITGAFSAVGEFFSGIFSDAWSGITNAFSTVAEFFESCWSAVKAPFETAAEWFGSIFDGVKEAIKAPINFIIDAINKVIGALNSLSIEIPSWVPGIGGDTWGINIPKIPRLAQGAVIEPNKPFYAMLGDQTSGTNIEAPLATIKQALSEVIAGGNQQIVIPVYIGKERIETIVANATARNNFISGGR